MFYRPIDDQDRRQYAGTFSRLRAGEVVFSPHLDLAFKQLVAARMRSAPEVREAPADPFLDLALDALSAGTTGGHLLYRLLLPLGRLQNAVLEWGDHLRVLSLLRSDPALRQPVARRAVQLDWTALAVTAEQEYRSRVEGHAFGFQQARWDSTQKTYLENQGVSSDAGFLAGLRSSTRWSDLELLFRLLRDQGTDVLVLSIPLDGPYMDFAGVSATARREYYRRLTGLAARYGLRCLTFEDREYEPWFRLDPGHPSPKGWVAFDQALDRFYHNESP
jgi:D-alanine transfer protein